MTLPPLHRKFDHAIADFYRGEWMFVGTRAGMNEQQSVIVRSALNKGSPLVLRHSGEWGAETECHAMWRELELPLCDVWPCDTKRVIVFQNQPRVHVNPTMTDLMASMEMVKRSAFVIGAPHTNSQEQSKTWQVLGQAMSRHTSVMIVWRNGKITLYHDNSLQRLVIDGDSTDTI